MANRPLKDLAEVSASDIATALKEINRNKNTIQKPSILFLGDSGVGKSTLIKSIFACSGDEMAIEKVKSLKTSSDSMATELHESISIPGQYFNCIDIAGRCLMDQAKESDEEYLTRVKRQSNNHHVELFIVVLDATSTRIKDCCTLYGKIMKELIDIEPHPFLVFINKIDKVNEKEGLTGPVMAHLQTKFHIPFPIIQTKATWLGGVQKLEHTWIMQSLPFRSNLHVGTFPVAASSESFLERKCPHETKINGMDIFDTSQSHQVLRPEERIENLTMKNQVVVCTNPCKKYYITEAYSCDKEFKDKLKPKLNHLEEERIPSKAVNLAFNDPALQKLKEIGSNQFLPAFIKELFSKNKDRARHCDTLIENNVRGVIRYNVAAADERLCSAIAGVFEFPQTGDLHKKIEHGRWQGCSPSSWWNHLLLRAFGDKEIEDYLASWGIFYVWKYSGLAHILMGNDSDDVKCTLCNNFLHTFAGADAGISIVKTIHDTIKKQNRNLAYDKYLENVTTHWGYSIKLIDT